MQQLNRLGLMQSSQELAQLLNAKASTEEENTSLVASFKCLCRHPVIAASRIRYTGYYVNEVLDNIYTKVEIVPMSSIALLIKNLTKKHPIVKYLLGHSIQFSKHSLPLDVNAAKTELLVSRKNLIFLEEAYLCFRQMNYVCDTFVRTNLNHHG